MKVRVLRRPIQTPYGRKAPGEVFDCKEREAAYWVPARLVEQVKEAPPKKRGRQKSAPAPADPFGESAAAELRPDATEPTAGRA